MRECFFFDVCGTLYSSNTTNDFYQYLFKNHRTRKILYGIFKSKPLKVLWKVLSLAGYSIIPRKISLSFLYNLRVDYVKYVATVFVKEELEKVKNNELHEKLIEAKRRGNTIVLVSASINPVVEAIALHLGSIDFISTILEEHNGRYTGFVKEDVEGLKLHKVEQRYSLKDHITWFYTDNREDLPLLERVTNPNIVIRKKKDALHWGKHIGKLKVTKYELLA